MTIFKNFKQAKYLLFLFILLEFSFFVLFRKVNLDEGWYLWASKLVYAEQQLYRDFAYTQTPLLPYVYGLFQSIFGQGLYQGRILSALLGVATGVISAWIVNSHLHFTLERGDSRQRESIATLAALFCMVLFATSFYTICYFVYSATYSLAAFFLVCAVGTAILCPSASRTTANQLIRSILSIIFISLAIATRMSAVGALPALLFYLIAANRPQKFADLIRSVLPIALTGIAAATILLGPFWLLSGELMYYNIFGFHTDRILRIEWQWERQLTTLLRSGWIYAAPLVLILIVSCLGAINSIWGRRNLEQRALKQRDPESVRSWRIWLWRNDFELLLGGMILGPLVLHLIPRTTDAYYNTLQFPLLCIVVSLLVARLWTPIQDKIPRLALLRYGLIGLLLLNSVIHLIALRQFDLISWKGRGLLPVNQVEVVTKAADFLHQIDKRDNQLLTLNTHLALQADMDVPRGYEMSIFSYRPDWTESEARRHHVVNNEMLIADLQAGADAVAITDFDAERFYGKRQQIFDTLAQNYRHAKTIPNFDPLHGNLNIYLPPQFGEPSQQYVFRVNFWNDVSDNEHRDGIELLGYDLATSRYQAGDTIDIALYWQASHQHLSQPYTAFVQVLDSAGVLVVGQDNPPCQQTCPTQSWQPREVLRDEYHVTLPDTVEAGQYIIQIGLYHSETIELMDIMLATSILSSHLDKNVVGEVVDQRLRLTRIEVR